MGTSTDAYLFYGFAIPGGEDESGATDSAFWQTDESDEDTEVDVFIAAKLGLHQPTTPFHRDADNKEYSEYWDKRHALLERVPVQVVLHCHVDAPMYALAIKASYREAYRGSPKIIAPEDLIVDAVWNRQLADFCKLVGIKMGSPSWMLVSYWG